MRKIIDFLYDIFFAIGFLFKSILFIPFICAVAVLAIITGLIFSTIILSVSMVRFITYIIKYFLKALNSLKKKSES